jgi:hypothetical protein
VAVCPTGALFTKGVGVAEMRHRTDVPSFLDTQRRSGEWTDRGAPS